MGAEEALVGILAARWFPRRLSSVMVRAYARWHARQVARADRDAQSTQTAETIGGPVYLADGFHGGIPFWDWLLLRSGGLWKGLLWPVVGEVLVRRARELGLPAILEIDGYTFSVMAEQQPEAIARLKECAAAGTIEIVNGTYAQPFLRTLSGESIIRQFAHGLAAIEGALGSGVTVYASQEPCFCAQLPQILAGFGFGRALVRTHWAPFGEEAAHDSPLVHWQGPDGSVVMAVPRHTWMDYGVRRDLHSGALRGNLTGAHASEWTLEDLRRFRAAAVERGSDPPLISSLEDLSPFEAPTFEAPALDATPDVRLTTLVGYCDTVLAGQRVEDLPRWQPAPDDFPLDLPWGLEGDRLMQARGRAEAVLRVAERADAAEQMLIGSTGMAGRSPREKKLAEAWQKLLLAQHHDLHVCGPWLSQAHGKPMSAVGVGLCTEAEDAARGVALGALRRLLERVDTRGFEGRPVLVFNPTARASQIVVQTEGRGIAFDGDNALATRISGDEVVFDCHVPELGWRVIDLRPGVPPKNPNPERPFEFANGFYRATLSEDGGLSLAAHGKELMQDGASLSLWRDGEWWPSAESPGPENPSRHLVVDSPVYRRWWVAGVLDGIPFAQTFTLYRALPGVDVTVTLSFRGAAFGPQPGDGDGYYAWDERKLCACFPMAATEHDGPRRVVHDAPFLVSETARSRFIGGRWAAVEGDGVGLAVLARGARGYTFDRESGLLRRVLAWSPDSWIYASDDSINGGGSRFTTLSGSHTFRYALLPYRHRSEAITGSDRYCLPPVAVVATRSAGDLPASGSLLQFDGDGVELSALFMEGGKPYARLWRTGGSEREVVIRRWGGGDMAAVGLRFEGGERLPDGRLAMRPWGVQTVRLESESE